MLCCFLINLYSKINGQLTKTQIFVTNVSILRYISYYRRGTSQPTVVQQTHSQVTQAQDQAQSCSTPQPSTQRSSTPVAPTETENQKKESEDHSVESPLKAIHTVGTIKVYLLFIDSIA